MLQVDVTAQLRSTFGKGAARTLRREGLTPAVMYGTKLDATALELDTKIFTKALLGIKRRNAVINLDVQEGKKKSTRHVMLKEIQTHPITDVLVHADFCEVSLEEPMVLDVPIVYTGKAKGVDLGGELVVSKSTVSLKGKLLDIPDNIKIDVTELLLGNKLTCKDLEIPGDITMMDSEDAVCVAVGEPSLQVDFDEEVEEETAAEEASTEEEAASEEA